MSRLAMTLEKWPVERVALDLKVGRVYNLGFTIRDAEKMQRHLEECYAVGVPELKVDKPPLIFPMSSWATITDEEVTVQRARTSGEVEIVTISLGGELYIGVGSDHTDRELETIDIPWSKQVAPNVLAPTLWRWEDVAGHWDDVMLESYVLDEGKEVLYQRASVAEFWTPVEMVNSLEGRVPAITDAQILFSGTVVSEGEQLNFGREWRIAMIDPVFERKIEHTYRVVVLSEEVEG